LWMNKRPPSKEEEELGVRIAKGFHCRSEESPLTVQSTAFNGIEKERELTTEERECEGKETPKKCGREEKPKKPCEIGGKKY
jgi:hypothetical protein